MIIQNSSERTLELSFSNGIDKEEEIICLEPEESQETDKK